MPAVHSEALAPYIIQPTWHPGSNGWAPRKWWHPSIGKPPIELGPQIELSGGASRSGSGADGLTDFSLQLIKSSHVVARP